MNDRKRGFTPPWQISRNMFLAEQEVAQLCRYLRPAADSGAPRQAALAARDRLLIEALLFSGLRNSELCGLRIDDALVGTMETVFLVRGTPRQDRTVYIPRSLGVLVEQFVRVHRPQLIRATRARTAASEDRLLVNDRGKPFDRTSLYRRVVATLTAAGLGERASVQLLRHTYGYLAYQRSGGNLLFIQRQMGHAHPMVSSVYAQFCEEDYSEIADRVAEATGTSSSATSELQRSLKKEKPRVRTRRSSQPRHSGRR